MASGTPAASLAQKLGMLGIADIHVATAALDLRVALEAQVGIALDQHFPIHGAVWVVTNRASFTQRLMLEDEWARLLPMALRAVLIEPRHGQPAAGLENVAAMRIMALYAVHAALDHRMAPRQIEFSVSLQMALKAGGRIFSRIDDELATAAARFDVLAARAVARFAAGFAL